MNTKTVSEFFARKIEKEIQTKFIILICLVVFTCFVGFAYVINIPKENLYSMINKDYQVRKYSKIPPAPNFISELHLKNSG